MDNELYCPMKMTSNPLGRCVCEKEKCAWWRQLDNWYAELEGVCVNDQSEHVADFAWNERGCKEWEKKDERK